MYELHLRWYNRLGILKHGFVEPVWARFTDGISGDEPLVFALQEDHAALIDATEFDIIEVMLRNLDLGITDVDYNFVRAGVYIFRDWECNTDDDGLTYYTLTAPSERSILSWRSVMYQAGLADRSIFSAVAAETIMKTLVKYNCTSFATVANSRHREGDLAAGMGIDITIAGDLGGGAPLSLACMGANLLDVLGKINDQAGGDFSFVWAGEGTADWTFDFHPGQLGADKSAGADRVLFSLKTSSMSNPRLRHFGARATTAIAAGKGVEDDRVISTVDGQDYATDNDIEVFVDARNEDTADGRVFRGAVRLTELQAYDELSFDVIQTSNQFYSPVAVTGRKTYRAGDLVLATYGTEQVRKIDKVVINWKAPQKNSPFEVSLVTREVPYAGS